MPSFKFTDQEPKTYELWPIGDYLWQVTACEFSIQNGGPCGGSDAMELTFDFQRNVGGETQHKEVTKKLIFHEKTAWVVDAFVKSGNLLIDGRAPLKNENIDFNERMVVGLRGWATLGVREYKSDRDGKMKTVNEVIAFITNKEKLAKAIEIDPMAHVQSSDAELGPDGKPLPF
jgi:hypothetical protein